MKKFSFLFVVPVILFSCFSVEKLEIPDELQEQLDMTKPVIIDAAEVNGVAFEIGDSIFKSLETSSDTSFYLGKNGVSIVSKSPNTNKVLLEKFEAYEYALDQDSSFKAKGSVKYGTKDSVAYYENAMFLENKEMKIVQIQVDLSEVNLKVVQARKERRKKQK